MNSLNQFADISQLENSAVQRLLGEILIDDCFIALRDDDNPATQALFRNMSDRVRDFVQEDIAAREGVQVHEVYEAQARILEVARSL